MIPTLGNVPMVTPADHVRGPKQGAWTYDDYVALSDDGKRYEIIHGVLFMTPPSPNEGHQTTAGEIFSYLRAQIQLAGLGRVYIAPFDVKLASNTVVQPDVLVVLNAHLERITKTCIVGAPDLVVEVISPGTADKDWDEKKHAYEQAGVPEYWIVDPAARTVTLFVLEEAKYRLLGVFEAEATLPSRAVPDFLVQIRQFFG